VDRKSGRVQRLAAQIHLLQRLMVRASMEGDYTELHRLADLVESHTIMITRLAPWFVHELVRGWTAHLPGFPHRKGQQRPGSRTYEKGDDAE
jgi:hypothetical protein